MSESVSSFINQTFGLLGLPVNEEPNAGSMRGLTVFPKTVERAENVREDAGRAYYWPVSNRPNPDISLESFVEKTIWHPVSGKQNNTRTASGVVFTDCNGTAHTILANREIMLSACSLRSPLLLQAAMMPRELGGVVDSNLAVYGTSNVRVVDASVVPIQICGHLTSTRYVVAEKAEDMIKARSE